jgi:hypothetical protein
VKQFLAVATAFIVTIGGLATAALIALTTTLGGTY